MNFCTAGKYRACAHCGDNFIFAKEMSARGLVWGAGWRGSIRHQPSYLQRPALFARQKQTREHGPREAEYRIPERVYAKVFRCAPLCRPRGLPPVRLRVSRLPGLSREVCQPLYQTQEGRIECVCVCVTKSVVCVLLKGGSGESGDGGWLCCWSDIV